MKDVSNIVDEIKRLTDIKPKIGIILGSHLGEFDSNFIIKDRINYHNLDSFPLSKTQGHKGRFLFGYLKNTPIVIMQGRVHYYEGYEMEDVVLPIKVMKNLGIEKLFITNSAMALNDKYSLGDLVLVSDYIMHVESPLRNLNIEYNREKLETLYPIFSFEILNVIKKISKNMYDVNIREGVYLQISGPLAPSKAESKIYKNLGADIVGMSSICESIYARYLGLDVACISCVSSYANGINDLKFSNNEFLQTYKNSRHNIFNILIKTIDELTK